MQLNYHVHHSSFAFSYIHLKYAQTLLQKSTSSGFPIRVYQELFEKEFNCKIISDMFNPPLPEYELQFNTNKDMTAFLLRFS